jgi:hypothetical protein
MWSGASPAMAMTAASSSGVAARRLWGATPTIAWSSRETAARLASRSRAKRSASLTKRRWPSFGGAPPKLECA